MSWEHPLILWAVPALAACVLLFEVRLPGGAVRSTARFVARTAILACAVAALAGPFTAHDEPRPRRLVLAVDAGGRRPLIDAAPAATAALTDRLRDAAAAAGLAFEVMHYTTRAALPGETPPASAESSLAAGLAGARLAFGEAETGGVIALTDGRSDLSGTRAAVDTLHADGIAVTGVAVPRSVSPPPDGATITAFDVPAQARGPFAVRARAHAPGGGRALWVLRVDGAEVARQDGPADAAVRFDELELVPGLHELALTLAVDGGAPTLARALVEVGAPPRVLGLLQPAATGVWAKALAVQGLALTATAPGDLRGALVTGTPPDLVVADAITLRALPGDAAALLRDRVHDGLGLVMVAGDDPAAWAALASGPLASVLPVHPLPVPPKPRPPPPEPTVEPPPPIEPPEEDEGPGIKAERRPEMAFPITLLLLVDRSGSMAFPIQRLEMAILGAQRAAEALSPWDRVGVITFASDVRVAVPIRSARGASTLAAWLSSVRPDEAAGTDMAGALRRAHQLLATDRSPIKHIILLTDGRQFPSGPIFGPVVKPMRRLGVTVTAVGIGRGANMSQLREIVQWAARGHVRSARTPDEIPRILTRDTQEVAARRRQDAEALDARLRDERQKNAPPKKATQEPDPKPQDPPPAPDVPPTEDQPLPGTDEGTPEALPLRRARAHEALAGFEEAAWPKTGAPQRSRARPGAAVLLERGAEEPVFVASRAGLGRVVAWLLPSTDAGTLAWEPLGRLLAQAARSALAPEGAFEYLPRPEVRHTSDGATLHVRWPPGSSSGHVEAVWIGPGEAVRALGTFAPGDGTRGRALPAAAAGSRCRIELTLPGGPSPPPLTYLAEAPARAGLEPGDPQALEAALGEPLKDPLTFARDLPIMQRRERRPRWALFLWIAIVLLPLDVFLHRRTPTA